MQIAQIFINELSWNVDNYESPEQLKRAVNQFQLIFSYLTKKAKEYENLAIFYKGESIKPFLQDLTDFEAEDLQVIRERLKKAKDWQDTDHKMHPKIHKICTTVLILFSTFWRV